MDYVLWVPVAFLAFATTLSGVGAIIRLQGSVAAMSSVGVPPRFIPVLGVVKIAGAVGLGIGAMFAPLGATSAACFILYFAVAFASHLRAGHSVAQGGPALLLCVISALAVPAYLT